MSFFKEWDFYYIPQTDYNPKWYNYYEQGKIAHDEACIYGVNQKCDTKCGTDWCDTSGTFWQPCNNCSGSGWSYLVDKKKCWRHRCVTNCGCGTRYLYKPTNLCYSNQSACKPEMINHKNDYRCNKDWDLRNKNLYSIYDKDLDTKDYNTCACVGSCTSGVIKASTYNPAVFAPLGGVGPDKLVKKIVLDDQNSVLKILNDKQYEVFRCTLQFSKITNWSVKTEIEKAFSTGNKVYEPYTYNNFVGCLIADCYMRMNLPDPTNTKTFTNFDKYFPVFLVLTNTDTNVLRDPPQSEKRDVCHDFYTGKTIITRDDTSKSFDVSEIKALSRDYVKLDGISPTWDQIYPAPDYKNSDAIFVVKPIMYTMTADYVVKDKYLPENKDPIIYMVYYSISQLTEGVLKSGIDPITPFKSKYIDNPNLNLSPECLAWNKFVYYNYLLPQLCFQNEKTDVEKNCPNIYNYDTNSYELSKAGCSLIASKRFPDCKKYLVTDIDLEQPAFNPTRTLEALDAKKDSFCNTGVNFKLNECQCYDRTNRTAYKQFQSTSYSFPQNLESGGNAGCWYSPCVDTKTSDILLPSKFNADGRNCPATVCENVITIINRPENTAKISSLKAVNSCSFLASLSPVSSKPPTTSTKPVSSQPDESSSTPIPEYEYDAIEPDQIVVGDIITTTDTNLDTGKLGLSILATLGCIIVVLILLLVSYYYQ